jgi:hypothetical protein
MVEGIERAARARSILRWTVFLALWGLITHGTHAGTGDEPHYLAIAHSIAFDGDVDLANNYGANEPLVGGGVLAPESHVQYGTNGAARPVHDIGLPLLFAPYVRIAQPLTRLLTRVIPAPLMQRARLNPPVLYRHLISLAMIGLTMVLADSMFVTFLSFGASSKSALASALLLTLSPPLLIFSVLFFTELVSALIAFLVFRHVVLVHTHGRLRWGWLGCAAGFLVLVHAKNVGLTLPLAGVALYKLRTRRAEAGAFALGLAAMLVVRTAVNYHFWGSLVSGPHARFSAAGASSMLDEALMRLAGLLVDQEFGLLPYAPIYVLAIVGFFVLYRRRRDLALAIACVVGVYVALLICPLVNVHGWTGGWNPAARFLTPVVPLLGLFVFVGIRTSPTALVLIIIVLQVTISAYAWQHPKILWNDGDGRASFCETTKSSVCAYLPSMARPGH